MTPPKQGGDVPGVPLSSGFTRWRRADDPEVALPRDAKTRIAARVESVRLARLHAMAHWHEDVIG